MPIYEYECDGCHHRFEKRQGFDAEPVSTCPRCQGRAHRVIHSVPVIFKGKGFYSTDHGRGYRGTGEKKETAPREESGDKKESVGKEAPKTAASEAPAGSAEEK